MRALGLLRRRGSGLFRRCGGRGRLDATQRLAVRVAGEVVHTELGRGGDWECVLYVIFLATRDVVVESRRLVPGHCEE